jgi:hypothetical protein
MDLRPQQIAEALLADLRAHGLGDLAADRDPHEHFGVDGDGIRDRDLGRDHEQPRIVERSELRVVGPARTTRRPGRPR